MDTEWSTPVRSVVFFAQPFTHELYMRVIFTHTHTHKLADNTRSTVRARGYHYTLMEERSVVVAFAVVAADISSRYYGFVCELYILLHVSDCELADECVCLFVCIQLILTYTVRLCLALIKIDVFSRKSTRKSSSFRQKTHTHTPI